MTELELKRLIGDPNANASDNTFAHLPMILNELRQRTNYNSVSNKAFPSDWHTTGAMSDLITDINNDETAVVGSSYLSTVSFNDLPAGMVQAELLVEVMNDDPTLGKVLFFTVTSNDTYPYHWEYTSAYGHSGSWKAFENIEKKVTSLSSNSTHQQYTSAKCVYDALCLKQDAPVEAGSDGQILSLQSSGPAWINAPEGTVVVDSEMSDESENPVQNKTIKAYVDQLGQKIDGVHEISRTFDNEQMSSYNRGDNKIALIIPTTSIKIKAESQMVSKPLLHIYHSSDGTNWSYINDISSSQYGSFGTYAIPNTAKYISVSSDDTSLSGNITIAIIGEEVDGINDKIRNLENADTQLEQSVDNLTEEVNNINIEINGEHGTSRTFDNTQLDSGSRDINKIEISSPTTSIKVKAESQMAIKPLLHIYYSIDGTNWTYINDISSTQYGSSHTYTIPNTAKYISLYSDDTALSGNITLTIIDGLETDGIKDKIVLLEIADLQLNEHINALDERVASIEEEIDGIHDVSKTYDNTTLTSGNRDNNKIELPVSVTSIKVKAESQMATKPLLHIYYSADGTNWTYINDIGSSQYGNYQNYTIPNTAKYISLYSDNELLTGNITLTISGTDVDGIKDKINQINTDITDIRYELGMAVPSYYATHIASKLSEIKIKDLLLGQNGDSFVFITDTHIGSNVGLQTNYNYGHSGELIRYINEHSDVKKVVHGGDFIDGGYYLNTGRLDVEKVKEEFRRINYVGVIGNHDTNASGAQSSASYFSNAEIYSSFIKNAEKHTDTNKKNYYYIDNISQKIRYVFLDLHWILDVDQRGISMDTVSQLAWLDTISSELGNEWSMLFFAHIIFDSKTYVEDYVFDWSIGTLANSFISKINEIAADTSKPTVIGVISGHTHYDYSTVSSEGYPIICSCDDAYWGFNAQGENVQPASYRVEGTISEQSFDVVHIDTLNRKIYMTKIGYGNDREFSY